MPENMYESKVQPHLERVAALSQKGLCEKAIAKALGISAKSLSRYKKRYRELAEALKGREKSNQEVLNAFFKRACGYISEEEVRELKEIKEEDGSTRKEMVTTKIVRKDVPPDLSAVKWWLENMGEDKPKESASAPPGEELAWARSLLQEKERLLAQLAGGNDSDIQATEAMGD